MDKGRKSRDLTGQYFGMWLVIHYSKLNHGSVKRHLWRCRCSCGIEKDIREDTLIDGLSRSCGCVNRRLNNENRRWKGYGEISASYWNKIESGASQRGYEFKVSIKEAWDLFIKQNRRCALTGLELNFSTKVIDYDGSASLDRIDSSKGYILDNIQWIDKRINYMKRDYKESEFIRLCGLVDKFSKTKKKPRININIADTIILFADSKRVTPLNGMFCYL